MSVLVSIIMPAFNAENYVADSIGSILRQTCPDFELIVIDDNSTDNTANIVAGMAEEDDRIIFLTNTRRNGPSGARNMGLFRARGEYLAFLDADDTWLPEHLEQGVEILETHKKLGAVFFNFKIVDLVCDQKTSNWFDEKILLHTLKTSALGENLFLIKENMFHALIEESFIQLQSLVLRKKARDHVFFNENICRGEDLDFIIRMYLATKLDFAFCTSITSNYYRHDESLTTPGLDNVISILEDHVVLFDSYFRNHRDDQIAKCKLQKRLYCMSLSLSYAFRKKKDFSNAMRFLAKSLRYGHDGGIFRELLKICACYMLEATPLTRRFTLNLGRK